MVQRIGGNRRKTRSKFTKHPSDRGKLSIRKFMQTFDVGVKVGLKADSAVNKGLYHPRFHGKTAVVTGKKGWCYEVELKDGSVTKTLIVHPSHLQRL